MWILITVIVIVLFLAFLLLRKTRENDDGYGGNAISGDSFFGKVKDACCTRMR